MAQNLLCRRRRNVPPKPPRRPCSEEPVEEQHDRHECRQREGERHGERVHEDDELRVRVETAHRTSRKAVLRSQPDSISRRVSCTSAEDLARTRASEVVKPSSRNCSRLQKRTRSRSSRIRVLRTGVPTRSPPMPESLTGTVRTPTSATVGRPDRRSRMTAKPKNLAIAERLEAFAALLDLAGASYYTARAYRRAADLIRSTPAPIAELVRAGRVRELHGIGAGIEARLRELVETGEIAELAELERTTAPELVGFGRLIGIGPPRMAELGAFLDAHTLAELREARDRLEQGPGGGPKTARPIREGLDP